MLVPPSSDNVGDWFETIFGEIRLVIFSLGGTWQTQTSPQQKVVRVQLNIPDIDTNLNPQLLSDREKEVIKLLAEGLRDREIAQKLFISDRTVKFHINNAVTKLNSRTRIQAIYQAYAKGLLIY